VPAERRRKWCDVPKHLAGRTFTPDHVYTFQVRWGWGLAGVQGKRLVEAAAGLWWSQQRPALCYPPLHLHSIVAYPPKHQPIITPNTPHPKIKIKHKQNNRSGST
jgi:hypothetical protein